MAPSTPLHVRQCAHKSRSSRSLAAPSDFSLTRPLSLSHHPFQRNFTSGVVPTLWWMFVIITVRPVLISPNTHSRVYILCAPPRPRSIHYSAARRLRSTTTRPAAVFPPPVFICIRCTLRGVHYTGTRSRGYCGYNPESCRIQTSETTSSLSCRDETPSWGIKIISPCRHSRKQCKMHSGADRRCNW